MTHYLHEYSHSEGFLGGEFRLRVLHSQLNPEGYFLIEDGHESFLYYMVEIVCDTQYGVVLF